MTTTPLSAERLAEIRERHADDVEMYTEMPGLSGPVTDRLVADRAALLAETDRLRAALAEAERERLLLARYVSHYETPRDCITMDDVRAATVVARRIVEAANGGRDGD